jgi:adenylylsulfate kinase-like enzyme
MDLRTPERTRDGPRPTEGRRPAAACVASLTGLSGAGRSTIAAERLRDRKARVEVLDGEGVRRLLSPDLGFSRAGRRAHVRRPAHVADPVEDPSAGR